VDPARLDEVRSRMDAITALYLKHKAGSIPELIDIREQFRSKLETIELGDDNLKEIRLKLERARDKLTKLADELHTGRQKIIPSLEKKMKETMAELGMVHAVFKIDLKKADDFLFNGIDVPDFLFSANGGMDLKLISKVASGGELSRLMLSLKAIVADKLQLPTIIFDEIDSGVSGEIADKVGNIILKMSQNLQVFNITHLPQVASKGKYHYKVYKYDDNGETLSHIKLLDKEERRKEIAQMLSGENLTGAALSNADELLGY
ncbi:MAG: DNA repair protein RecN, partial [Bacteroidota bacterium]